VYCELGAHKEESSVESIVLFDNIAISAASGDETLIIYDLNNMIIRQKVKTDESGFGGFTRLALSNI
jgi:hypothetical protein